MARWKLLRGPLSDKNATPVSLGNRNTKEGRTLKDWEPPADEEAAKRFIPPTFYPGDIFDSPINMDKYNLRGSICFVKVEDYLPEHSDALGPMTVAELRQFAEDEEIEVPKGLVKAKLLQAIRSQLSYNEATAEDG